MRQRTMELSSRRIGAVLICLGCLISVLLTSFSLLKDKLGDVLCSLTERERKVLELRFGLGDGYSRTLEEVGKQFRVTRERIRQIEAKALRKMRHPTRIRQLHGFLEVENIEAF